MAGFRYFKNAYGLPAQELEKVTINASATVKLGGLVRIDISGNPTANRGAVCTPVAAGEPIYGLVEGIVTKDGIPLEASDTSTYDGTLTPGAWGAMSYAAAADNLTDKQVAALVRPLRLGDLLSNATDETFGTTTGSKTRFNFTDTIDDVSIDENNAGNAVTTVAQFIIWGTHPDDTTLGLYMPKELQIEVA